MEKGTRVQSGIEMHKEICYIGEMWDELQDSMQLSSKNGAEWKLT